jgi:hypothetical protein
LSSNDRELSDAIAFRLQGRSHFFNNWQIEQEFTILYKATSISFPWSQSGEPEMESIAVAI